MLETSSSDPLRGESRPTQRRQFVPMGAVLAAYVDVGDIDFDRFRADVDRFVDQNPEPLSTP